MPILLTWQEPNRYHVEMADYAKASTIGARIAAARRSRGFSTPDQLVAAMPGSGITAAVLANIENGRRANLDVSQLLNIALSLGVPVSSLLAPMSRPNDPLDLSGLGDGFAEMTAADFDAWLSALPSAGFIAGTAHERNERTELQALRELRSIRKELARLDVVISLESDAGLPEEIAGRTKERSASLKAEATKLREYLISAGWEL